MGRQLIDPDDSTRNSRNFENRAGSQEEVGFGLDDFMPPASAILAADARALQLLLDEQQQDLLDIRSRFQTDKSPRLGLLDQITESDVDPIFSPERSVMIAALGDRASLFDSDRPSVARAVYEAAKPFATTPLPVNVSDTLFRFLCVSAGCGLWEALPLYPPMSTILIRYYFEGATLASLHGDAQCSLGQISRLITSETDKLWRKMPSPPWFPIDKVKLFPLEKLRRGRAGLSSLTQKKQWAEDKAGGGARKVALSAALRKASQRPEVRQNRSEGQTAAWQSPLTRQHRLNGMQQRFQNPDRRDDAYAKVRKASDIARAKKRPTGNPRP